MTSHCFLTAQITTYPKAIIYMLKYQRLQASFDAQINCTSNMKYNDLLCAQTSRSQITTHSIHNSIHMPVDIVVVVSRKPVFFVYESGNFQHSAIFITTSPLTSNAHGNISFLFLICSFVRWLCSSTSILLYEPDDCYSFFSNC